MVDLMKIKKWKLLKLYETGEERLSRDFDVVNILRTMRNNRLLIRKYLVTAEQKEAIMNNPNKFINLDTSIDEEQHLDDQTGDTKFLTKPLKIKGI